MAEFEFVECASGTFLVADFEELFRFGGRLVAKLGLAFDELFDRGFVLVVLLRRVGGGAGNDEGRAGLVDEDRVDLVDDGDVVAALDLFVLGGSHAVVAKIIEAELRIGAVSDVAGVFLAAFPWGHLVLDAADAETEEAVERAHPVRVAACEVVVDRHDVDSEAGEGVEVDGQCGDEGFAFAGLHLGDHAAVECDATDELDIEVDHFPEDRVVVDGDRRAAHPACGVFHDRVGFGENLLEVFRAGLGEIFRDFVEGCLGGFDGFGVRFD